MGFADNKREFGKPLAFTSQLLTCKRILHWCKQSYLPRLFCNRLLSPCHRGNLYPIIRTSRQITLSISFTGTIPSLCSLMSPLSLISPFSNTPEHLPSLPTLQIYIYHQTTLWKSSTGPSAGVRQRLQFLKRKQHWIFSSALGWT